MTTVYLAGPINGCTDEEAHGWRDGFMAQLPDLEFRDPMVRDYRGIEDDNVAAIIDGDLEDIDGSDVMLAYCWQVSWGTAMEIRYAFAERGMPVLIVMPAGQRISPWLRGHSTAIVQTLDEAAETLREWRR